MDDNADKAEGLNIAEVLKGNEGEVVAVLGKARPAELKALHETENAEDGKKRLGVTEAIEAEQADRVQLAKDMIGNAVEAADHAGIDLFVFTERDQFAEPDEAAKLKLRVAELEQQITEQNAAHETAMQARDEADAQAAPKPKKAKKRKLAVSDKAKPDIAALAFATEDGTTLRNFPDLDTDRRALKREREGFAYMREIVFPEDVAGAQPLRRIFALDDKGKAIAECRLVSALPVGGASEARIPAGSLFFGDWPKADD